MKVPIQDFKKTTIEESIKSWHSGSNFISWGELLGFDLFDDIVQVELYRISASKDRVVPWSLLNGTKVLLLAALIVLKVKTKLK